MTQPDPVNNPPPFVERLDLTLYNLWCFLLCLPIIYLIPVSTLAYWLNVQVPLPKTAEDWSNLRLGIVILVIGGCVLHSIFSEIVFLVTGKKTKSFESAEKKTVLTVAVTVAIISIGVTSFAIWANSSHK
jgi:NO-binding membrane sensor protein with MHYT domain